MNRLIPIGLAAGISLGSVERAEDRAASELNAAIARARAFDAEDNRAECLKAVEEIRRLTGMQ
jgi:hypothetical protein